MMRSCSLFLAAWLIGWLMSGCQAKADDWAGNWVWSVEERPAMVLRLDASAHGDLSRPLHLTMDANAGYWRMIDASSELATIAVTPVETSVETITLRAIDSLRGETTNYRLTRTGPDEAELTLADIPDAPPFPLRRAATPTTVATDWIPGQAYGRPPLLADNPELTRLFAEDQAARQGTAPIGPDITRHDTERRVIVRRLLDAGQVRSGTDHYHAAFIFQHGDRPDDYLLAHAMAVAAVARGRDDAAWIAAATLDRYLQSTGRSQIYGTQFQIPNDGSGANQGAYDRALLPDSLRTITGVPPLAAQAQQLREYDRDD